MPGFVRFRTVPVVISLRLQRLALQQIRQRRVPRLQCLTDAMPCLHALLLRRLDRHLDDLPAAIGFKHPRRIRAIGFVAADVRSHVARRQQTHRVSLTLEHPRPMMRAAAGRHHHPQWRVIQRTP